MSARLIHEVWQYSDVNSNELLILLCIADGCTDDGRFGWYGPDLSSLCKRARMTREDIDKHVTSLSGRGLLSREPEGWLRIGGGDVR